MSSNWAMEKQLANKKTTSRGKAFWLANCGRQIKPYPIRKVKKINGSRR